MTKSPKSTEASQVHEVAVTQNGAIRLPKVIRDELSIKGGDRVRFVSQKDKIVIKLLQSKISH